MRIAFVAYDRPGYHAGPIVNARRLLPEWKRLGHEPIGLFMHQEGGAPTVDYLRAQGIECRIRTWKGDTEDRLRWFLEQLSAVQPDVFVPNISVSGWFAGRWAREAGIPSVAAMRGDDPFHWDMIRQFVTGDPAWAISGVVAVSEGLKSRIAEMKPRQTSVTVIPSGVPVPEQSLAQHAPLRLCYLGRLIETNKHVMRIAEIFCRTLQRDPTATAQFVGTGPALAELQAFVSSQGLASRIHFPGSIAAEKVSQQLSGGSLVLLASDHEGTPGALMDAMACGLVPVCAEIPGGLRELVLPETTGVLVDNQVESFVTAIQQLGQDKTRWERLSANAREHIRSNYSLPLAAERWISFCQELMTQALPKAPIKIPRRFHLPPVKPGLAEEDRRHVGLLQQFRTQGKQMATGLWRRLSTKPGSPADSVL